MQRTLLDGVVFWYDSIIDGGQLQWQNEVNAKNVRFLHCSNGMLINYTWNDRSLMGTGVVCEQEQTPRQNVFFGIDIFGRGQVAKFQSKRTLARISRERFSTGIFAPGWTYETLQQYGYNIKEPYGLDDVNEAFLLRNEKFWWLLWENFATHPYHELPFYTDFCLGSGKRYYTFGQPNWKNPIIKDMSMSMGMSRTDVLSQSLMTKHQYSEHFLNLSRQSLQPSVPLHQLVKRCYDDAFHGGSCLEILHSNNTFRLFACDFQFPGKSLICAYAYKLPTDDGEFDCVLRFCIEDNLKDCYLFLGDYYNSSNLQRGRCYVSPLKRNYYEQLDQFYTSRQLPCNYQSMNLQAAKDDSTWQIRYYIITFDSHIQIKDIGLLYRKSVQGFVDTPAYFGAIYLNEYPYEMASSLPVDSNALHIPISKDHLLN